MFIVSFAPAAPFASAGASPSVLNDPARVEIAGHEPKDNVCLTATFNPKGDFDLNDGCYYTPEVAREFDDLGWFPVDSPPPSSVEPSSVASPQSPFGHQEELLLLQVLDDTPKEEEVEEDVKSPGLELLEALGSFEGVEDVGLLDQAEMAAELNVLSVEETEKELAALASSVEEMTREQFDASSMFETMKPIPMDVLTQAVTACDLPFEVDVDELLFGQDSQDSMSSGHQMSPYYSSAVSSVTADFVTSDDSASSIGSPAVVSEVVVEGEKKQKKKLGRRRLNVDPENRRLKKREQNREAATRYRMKKKEQEQINLGILKKLQEENKQYRKKLKQIQALLMGAKMMARASLR